MPATAASITSKLRAKGATLTVKQRGTDVDPDAGTVLDPTDETSLTVYGVFTERKTGSRSSTTSAGGSIAGVSGRSRMDDSEALVSANDSTGSSWTPGEGDVMTVGGRDLHIVKAAPLMPQGTILAWTVLARSAV